MRSTLDTSGLTGREGFDFWQEVLTQQIMPVAARSRLGTSQFDPADAGRLSSVAIDLISLMFARRLQAEDDLPGASRANALYARIQAYILDRLGDPTLSPVTRLFTAAYGMSPSDYRAHHTTDGV